MTRIPVLFIYDEPYDEIYCATNLSESDALEIIMSAIEETVKKRFNCDKFDKESYKKALVNMTIYYDFAPVF